MISRTCLFTFPDTWCSQTWYARASALSVCLLFVLSFILILPEKSLSQSISGRVVDASTGDPLPSANIYLSNTTYGISSGPDGEFNMQNLEPGQYQIVLRYIGYEESVRPVEVLPATRMELGEIPLKPNPLQLNEVEIVSQRESYWQQNLETFTTIFLGSSSHARHTEILNPEILHFPESGEKNVLSATADRPIHILNRSLGYELWISLRSFSWNVKERTGEFYFTSRMQELSPGQYPEMSSEWRKNRREVYLGSFRHFLDLLTEGRETEEFSFKNGRLKRVYPGSNNELKAFTKRRYRAYTLDTGRRNKPLEVVYKKNAVSQIETRDKNLLLVDQNGNLRNPQNIILSGFWSENRVADLLPLNYTIPGSENLANSPGAHQPDKKLDPKAYPHLDPSMLAYAKTATELINSGEISPSIDFFPLARTYLMITAVENRKDRFEGAFKAYLRSLTSLRPDKETSRALRHELLSAEPIIPEHRFQKLETLLHSAPETFGAEFTAFIRELDPTPALHTNERLIEHYQRVYHARKHYTNPEQEKGFDARGRIYIKYGEPDFIFDKPFTINRGDLYAFVSEFQFIVENREETTYSSVLSGTSNNRQSVKLSDGSGRSSQSQAYVIVDEIERMLSYIPFGSSLRFWIYEDIRSEGSDNTLFYFSEEWDGVFKELSTLEDWISPSLFLSRSAMSSANFAPALALQYITYQRLKYYDRRIMKRYDDMEAKIFNNAVNRSDAHLKQLSREIRTRHQMNTFKHHASAQIEKSAELLKVNRIPLRVYQYRMMNESGERIWATFLESRPMAAFLDDLTRNQDLMINERWPEERIMNEISRWYTLRKGVELTGPDKSVRGRISGSPALILDGLREDAPSLFAMNVPHSDNTLNQNFYAYLKNTHPASSPEHQTVYPTDLRGIGTVSRPQDDHFNLEETSILVSDILIGHTRLEDDSNTRFPFVISHEKMIPEGSNVNLHFEVYRLKVNNSGTAHFQVDYDIIRDGRSREDPSTSSGRLDFTTDNTRFSESLELKDLKLETGTYTLKFFVSDHVGKGTSEQEIRFEVVEKDRLFQDIQEK